jgi:hypothetical protein
VRLSSAAKNPPLAATHRRIKFYRGHIQPETPLAGIDRTGCHKARDVINLVEGVNFLRIIEREPIPVSRERTGPGTDRRDNGKTAKHEIAF